MTEDREILEQIRRDEEWLVPLMKDTPAPSAETMVLLRQAVAVELERDVLACATDPTPQPTTMASVKLAVRTELARYGRRSWSSRTWRIFGVAAAAACVALAVGLMRLVMPTAAPTTTAESRTFEEVADDMALAFQSLDQRRDGALSMLDQDISHMTSSRSTDTYDAAEAELRSISDEIDNLKVQSLLTQG